MLTVPVFSGLPSEDAEKWLQKFIAFTEFKGIHANNIRVSGAFLTFLSGQAENWFNSLPDATKNDRGQLFQAFRDRFIIVQPATLITLQGRKLLPSETIDNYANDIEQYCNQLQMNEQQKIYQFLSGLDHNIFIQIMLTKPATLADAIQAARIALMTSRSPPSMPNNEKQQTIQQPQPQIYFMSSPPFASNNFPSSSHGVQTNLVSASQFAPNMLSSQFPQFPQNNFASSPQFPLNNFASSSPQQHHTLLNTIGELTQSVKQLQQSQQQNNASSNNNISGISTDNNRQGNIICQLCGGFHNARMCYQFTNRQDRPNRYNPDFNITCFNCGKRGHRAAVCRKSRSNNRPNNYNNSNNANSNLNN